MAEKKRKPRLKAVRKVWFCIIVLFDGPLGQICAAEGLVEFAFSVVYKAGSKSSTLLFNGCLPSNALVDV